MPTMPPIGDDISVFLYTGGQQYGPYNRNVCKQLIDNGQLTKQTLVWMKGMAAWSHAEEVAELQPLFSIVPLETSSVLPPPPPILPPANPYSSLTSTKDPGKQKEQVESFAYSSIFAPAEVKRKSHMLVQVYLHLYDETEKVKALAQESQKDAERRDYIPLQCKLKTGDTVDVLLNIYGETY